MNKMTVSLLSAFVLISSGAAGAAGEETSDAANDTQTKTASHDVLNSDVIKCIQDNRPWSDCYNLQLGKNGKKVGKGFSGFHDDVFGSSSVSIGSIWIPTPAELFSRPRGTRN